MQIEQKSLFNEKKYRGVVPSPIAIVPPTPDATVLETLPAYKAYLQSGDYSKYTPDDFYSDMKKFGRFMMERKGDRFSMNEKKIKDITIGDIQQWIGELKKIMTKKTVSRKITTLNNYFLWLQKENAITNDPMRGIHSMRVTSPLADILTGEELKTLLETASKDSRNYFIFLLFIKTGITLEELRRLKPDDFHFGNRFAPEVHIKYVTEKEHKDRCLPLPQETKTVFDEYNTNYTTTDVLFPYSPRGIRFIMAQVVQTAGIKKRVSPQILRDSFAVQCLKQGENLESVLEKLGLKPIIDDDAGKKYAKFLA